jgi:hypothetical protein
LLQRLPKSFETVMPSTRFGNPAIFGISQDLLSRMRFWSLGPDSQIVYSSGQNIQSKKSGLDGAWVRIM